MPKTLNGNKRVRTVIFDAVLEATNRLGSQIDVAARFGEREPEELELRTSDHLAGFYTIFCT